MKLDRNRPYGQTFGADAGAMPLFQDNVYFNVQGDVVDCHYNREHSPHLFAAPAVSEPAPAVTATSVVPPVVSDDSGAGMADMLASRSDAEIYTAAVKLRAMLDEADDADKYVPDPTDKALSIAFLLRHHGA